MVRCIRNETSQHMVADDSVIFILYDMPREENYAQVSGKKRFETRMQSISFYCNRAKSRKKFKIRLFARNQRTFTECSCCAVTSIPIRESHSLSCMSLGEKDKFYCHLSEMCAGVQLPRFHHSNSSTHTPNRSFAQHMLLRVIVCIHVESERLCRTLARPLFTIPFYSN